MDQQDDATHPGVSDDPAVAAATHTPPPPSADDDDDRDDGAGRPTMAEHRMSRLDEIASRAAADRDAAMGNPPSDPDADPDDDAAAAARAQLERDGALGAAATGTDPAPARQPVGDPAAAAPAGSGGEIDPDAIVRLKVDGRIVERRLGDVLRDEQKLLAADARLAEATRILRDAQARAAAPSGEAPTTVHPSANPNPPTAAVKERVKDALGAVFNGDEDAAAERFAEVLASIAPAQGAAIDVDAVADAVTRRTERNAALQGFLGTYQAIAADEALQDAADRELVHVQQMYPHLTYAEQLQRAGNRVYLDAGLMPPSAPNRAADPGQPTATTDRSRQIAARKAQLDTPVARSGSAAPAARPPMSSEQARSSIVAEMAARRRGELQRQ